MRIKINFHKLGTEIKDAEAIVVDIVEIIGDAERALKGADLDAVEQLVSDLEAAWTAVSKLEEDMRAREEGHDASDPKATR